MRDGVGDGGDIEGELALELSDIADVVHALVEAAAEFGSDGLDGNAFIGDGGEDEEQLEGVWALSVSSIEISGMKLPAPLAGTMVR